MLQDADSKVKHVMSSTQANAIQANPLQFPFSTLSITGQIFTDLFD